MLLPTNPLLLMLVLLDVYLLKTLGLQASLLSFLSTYLRAATILNLILFDSHL